MTLKDLKDGCLAVALVVGVALAIGAYVLYQLFGGNGKPFGG